MIKLIVSHNDEAMREAGKINGIVSSETIKDFPLSDGTIVPAIICSVHWPLLNSPAYHLELAENLYSEGVYSEEDGINIPEEGLQKLSDFFNDGGIDLSVEEILDIINARADDQDSEDDEDAEESDDNEEYEFEEDSEEEESNDEEEDENDSEEFSDANPHEYHQDDL